ncbi:MAG: alpha/beta fold hydrolase [Anaerolineae bacterium]|nr:alpha/beta fold hydrolase [Anaerolineae bacterium]
MPALTAAPKTKHYYRNLILFGLAVFALIIAGLGINLAHGRAMGLVHPDRHSPDRNPSDLGIATWEEIHFPTPDGLLLAGWFIPPGAESGGATIIFVHGLHGNRSALLDEAAGLAAHGYGALLLDMRNQGESQGTVTTLGLEEWQDVRGAVDYLLTRPEVNPERIGLVGHSMGGATAIRAAARIPEVRAVIAESAFTSIEDNISESIRAVTGLPAFPFAPLVIFFAQREAGVDMHQMRPIDDLKQISPRAIMFIHGQLDEIISVNNSYALYAAAAEPKELYIIPNTGHGGLPQANPPEFSRRVLAFLAAYLR